LTLGRKMRSNVYIGSGSADRAPARLGDNDRVLLPLVVAVLRSALILAGEPVSFDAAMAPRFTPAQIAGASAATRAGLARWAATEQGRGLLAALDPREIRVVIIEDAGEDGSGRAPQPAIGTLVATRDHSVMKSYLVIINPTFGVTRVEAVPGAPASAADLVAVAFAGEMLHVAFYARGISLPHHERADFQREWREVAYELGYPSLRHGEREGAAGSVRGAR
jgi:hypothetical protein